MENMAIDRKFDSRVLTELQSVFEERSKLFDQEGSFVHENYGDLKKHRFFSACIPEDLGGGGVSHSAMCQMINKIAQSCGSTALAFSMHQHLIAAAQWKFKHKGVGDEMLSKVANNELILISTGAGDWLGSSGILTKTEGGYLFNGKKHFASQSVAGNVIVTSAQFKKADKSWDVLHFSVPMKNEGIHIIENWNVMGMRASGSHTIEFNDVLIPESSISLARPKDEFHMIWDVVLTVALPLIMSTYVGIAEKAMRLAFSFTNNKGKGKETLPAMIGKMNNALLSAKTQWKALISLANDLDFQPSEQTTVQALSFKTNISKETKEVVSMAMEIVGGQSFFKTNELERLFRDVQASEFHPLPTWQQYEFTGKRLLKNE